MLVLRGWSPVERSSMRLACVDRQRTRRCHGRARPRSSAGPAGRARTFVAETTSFSRVTRANLSTDGAEADGTDVRGGAERERPLRCLRVRSHVARPGDRNGVSDVFVRDLVRRRTWRASISSSGAESDGPSMKPSISADGSVVAFPSSATNLVPDDRNGVPDVFVRDRAAGLTERIERGTARARPTPRALPRSSARTDGRSSFSSDASNLVPADGNGDDGRLRHGQSDGTDSAA